MAEKRRVVLLCEPNLLGEILDRILNGLEEVELVGVWPLDLNAVASLEDKNPDILVIADERGNEEVISAVTIHVLETLRVKLDRNVLQIYTSQTLPAQVADLAEMIRQIPISRLGV
jgi:chemotaxis response regulator CheB